MIFRRLHDVLHALRRTDIAGIDAQARRAVLGRFDGALIMEVDVGHDRHVRRARDRLHGLGRIFIGTGHTHDVGAGFFERANLRDRGIGVASDRVGHALDGNRGVAADLDLTDLNLPRFAARDVAIGSKTHGSAHLTD